MRLLKKTYSMVLKLITIILGANVAKCFDTLLRFKRKLNLKKPKTLADKVSYLELHQSTDLITSCTDKWAVREYIKDNGFESILVQIVGGPWSAFDEMDWNKLPESFVLKATHGCKMNLVVKNKNDVDLIKCKDEVNYWLKTTYGTYSMEPHYYGIPHRFYAEKYLGDVSRLVDYKFHCINGKPDFILAVTDRKSDGEKAMSVSIHMFDVDWKPINEVVGYGNEKKGDCKIEKPKHFYEMLDIAKKLSKAFPFVRVDLYDTEEGVLFGELTFSPAACVFPYLSEKFLFEEGKKLKLEVANK